MATLKMLPTCLLLSLALQGCTDSTPPPPPMTKSELTIELFDALLQNNHNTTLKKISRLKGVDKGNVFLEKLENRERNNLYITQVQQLLNTGSLDKAETLISDAIKEHGRLPSLLKTQNELKLLHNITTLVSSLQHSNESLSTAKDAVALRTIAETYKPASPLMPLVDKKIAEAFVMEKWEKQRSLFDLSSDINILAKADDPEVHTLMAILATQSPHHSRIEEYIKDIEHARETRTKENSSMIIRSD